jgi:predicted TIM-barrel fold metal-dependent hydrolase
MPHFLSDDELKGLVPGEEGLQATPIPTQIVSNGEFNPLPQTEKQRQVEFLIGEMADQFANKQGITRREFLASAAGMATAFVAMNKVYGPMFDAPEAEAADREMAIARAEGLSGQFIFDDQTHFVRDDFKHDGLLGLAAFASKKWNPSLLEGLGINNLARYKFENYVKEVFVDSDTKVALLSGAPFDDPTWDLLSNDQIAAARHAINRIAGSRRLLGHSVFTPNKPGWMDEVDRCIAEVKPDAWKGYTIGDPLSPTKMGTTWRLDDEKLMYPMYEKIVAAGITTIAIHKGLLPQDYEKSWPGIWRYNTVWDVGQAAKDWPQINFVIYHAGLRPFLEDPETALNQFEKSGRIDWATDLAEIPQKYGVNNVYGEIGTAFAVSAVANPRFCAAFMGTLIRGLGASNVVWGSDSVWYGSPQWQIEALRRLEIPEDMQRKHRFAALGGPTGLVKNAIFGGNSTRLYSLETKAATGPAVRMDQIAAIRNEYNEAGGQRANAFYGYVAPKNA